LALDVRCAFIACSARHGELVTPFSDDIFDL